MLGVLGGAQAQLHELDTSGQRCLLGVEVVTVAGCSGCPEECLLPGPGSCFVEEQNQASPMCPGGAKCLLSDVGIEHLKCHGMGGSHQMRGSRGGSGDLDMAVMVGIAVLQHQLGVGSLL